MNLHYKIVEVWPSDHLIVARYWTDILSEEFLASDSNRNEDGTPVRCRSDVSLTLPIPAPIGKELEDFIIKQAPIEWLKTLEKVQAPDIDTSMSDIIKLKNTSFTVDVSKLETQFDTLTDEQIQEMIDKITANDR
jgi:hypothetical protein